MRSILKRRPTTRFPRLSRREFFSRMQLAPAINNLIEKAYGDVLKREWRYKLKDDPHGRPWHVSFHASQFPGDDPHACSRAAMYGMADFYKGKPPSRRLVMTANAGLAIEHDLVSKMHDFGILISAPPDAEVQTGFSMDEYRLTGTVDSAVNLRGRATPVEIKTKHEGDILAMREGKRGPDKKHVKQLKTQMGMVRSAQEAGDLWEDLKICTGGYIYYLPRDTKYDPSKPVPTAEFYVEWDEGFFLKGLDRLSEFMSHWEEEELEQKNDEVKNSRSHPMGPGWQWSKDPCLYCEFKKTCQQDFREGVTDLAASSGVLAAKEINPEWSYDEARKRVEDAWS